MSKKKVTKAVFPVAGMGTRFLPATKSVPKEIMTLVDKPLIQYAIDEAREAGIEDFIFVTSRGKSALENYFDRAPELESRLEASGKYDALELLRETNMSSGSVAYIRQDQPQGLGHAVWCARRLLGNEPFAVILPDDVIAAERSCLDQMVEAYEETGGCMVATMEVEPHQVSSYGVVDVAEQDDRLIKAAGMVEKPSVAKAPSNLAVIGRYILHPRVLRHLNERKIGAGGEIQLTDAIAKEIDSKDGVYGYRFDGKRFDCGSKIGFLQATVSFGLERDDLSGELGAYIDEIARQRAAQT